MTIGSALIAVQTAAYARIIADGRVTVYDAVPENAPGPYAVLGDTDRETSYPSFGRDGRMLNFVMHVWSQGFGWNEASQIAAILVPMFHNQPLALSTNTNSWITFNHLERMRDPDGIWRQVLLYFDLQVEE